MKQSDIIANKIERFRTGYVFTPSDFYEDVSNPVVVSRILSKFVKEGRIRRIAKGKFDKPAKSVLGTMPPSVEWLTRDYLFDGKKQIGYLTGTSIFTKMGLTTQISSVTEIGSNSYRRPLSIKGTKVRFILQRNTINPENIPLLQLLDAIRFVKTIPATTVDEAIAIIRNIFLTKEPLQRNRLQQLALNYAPYVRALAGAILDSIGDETATLFKSLNPISEYKIGITIKESLDFDKWRIV